MFNSPQPSSRLVYTIVLGAFCERFSYYGMLTILVLYLSKTFLLSDESSYTIYGIYTALVFAMPIVGGIIADRLIGLRSALFLGFLLLVIGNLFLSINHFNFLYIGLAFTVWGSGFYKANCANLVGILHEINNYNRERGLTFLYVAMNVGALLGPITYGFLSQTTHWYYGFLLSAIILLVSSVIFLYSCSDPQLKNALVAKGLAKKSLTTIFYVLLAGVCFLTSLLFFYQLQLSYLLSIFAVVVLVALITVAIRRERVERNRIFALLILFCFVMFFFTASLQVVSSISFFLERDVNRELFGWAIPTPLFSALYPLSVVVAAPFVTRCWGYFFQQDKGLFVTTKLIIGLLSASISFVCFSFAALSTHGQIVTHWPLFWIFIANILLGVGEICLMPAVLAAISYFSPANLKSTMIGVLFLFIAFSGYLSSLVAKATIHMVAIMPESKFISIAIYHRAFNKISFFVLLAAILLFILSPIVKSMMLKEGVCQKNKGIK